MRALTALMTSNCQTYDLRCAAAGINVDTIGNAPIRNSRTSNFHVSYIRLEKELQVCNNHSLVFKIKPFFMILSPTHWACNCYCTTTNEVLDPRSPKTTHYCSPHDFGSIIISSLSSYASFIPSIIIQVCHLLHLCSWALLASVTSNSNSAKRQTY